MIYTFSKPEFQKEIKDIQEDNRKLAFQFFINELIDRLSKTIYEVQKDDTKRNDKTMPAQVNADHS